MVLLLIKNAPPTVAGALMLNAATEAEFVATEGLARVAAAKEHVGRTPLLYGVISDQPGCKAAVSPAAGVLEAPAPYKPKYQVVICVVDVRAEPHMYCRPVFTTKLCSVAVHLTWPSAPTHSIVKRPRAVNFSCDITAFNMNCESTLLLMYWRAS